MFGVEHEEYLEAVDPTSYVGTIPLPDFFFFLFFPVQQTTSGIGHRVK